MRNNNTSSISGLIFTIVFGLVFSGFGLFWTIMVWRTAHTLMAFFGLIFAFVGLFLIGSSIYRFIKAKTGGSSGEGVEYANNGAKFPSYTSAEDFPYSTNDATPQNESAFCPFCGAPVSGDYEFCNKCGKKLP